MSSDLGFGRDGNEDPQQEEAKGCYPYLPTSGLKPAHKKQSQKGDQSLAAYEGEHERIQSAQNQSVADEVRVAAKAGMRELEQKP